MKSLSGRSRNFSARYTDGNIYVDALNVLVFESLQSLEDANFKSAVCNVAWAALTLSIICEGMT